MHGRNNWNKQGRFIMKTEDIDIDIDSEVSEIPSPISDQDATDTIDTTETIDDTSNPTSTPSTKTLQNREQRRKLLKLQQDQKNPHSRSLRAKTRRKSKSR